MMKPLLALALVGVTGAAAAQALPSPDALRSAATENAGLLQQYREIMRDPDPNVRLSAFTQLAVVDDPVIRQMAYDEAFGSTDSMLRAMALRYSFFDRAQFTMRFPSSTDQPITVSIESRDHSTGDFRHRVGVGAPNIGRVQGFAVEMLLDRCDYAFLLNDEDMLVGESNCRGTIRPVMIDLRG